MTEEIKIGVIGAGTMGETISTNLLKNKVGTKVNLFISDRDPGKLLDLKKKYGIAILKNNQEIIKKTDIIILAIKPQDFKELAEEIKDAFRKNQIVLSIMAGISLRNLKTKLNHQKIIRSMPNLAAKVGQAMTVWMAGFKISKKEEIQIRTILSSFGKEIKVTKERYLNLATAVSGSGPGYVFYFIEALTEAAIKLGFSGTQAKTLVDQTLIGAGELYRTTGEKAHALRQKVTSKKGTTEAAIKLFEKSKLKQIIYQGIKKALKRARELEK